MAIYKLEENPNIFISPVIDNRFVYRMMRFNDETNFNHIRNIDLRRDRLIIYGTEIKESVLHKLYDSLCLQPPRTGRVYVNCKGACYISVLVHNAIYRTINNTIFDWSPFGVIVPNTTNDVLTKQLHQKDQELEAMKSLLSSAKDEASTNEARFKASRQEVQELRVQLSRSQKDQEDTKMELQKVRNQLSSIEFELETKKIEFELSENELKELQGQLSASMMVKENMEKELQIKEERISSVEAELQSTKIELESSIENTKDIESQLCSCMKEKKEVETELQKVQNELRKCNVELESSKSELEASHERILQLEEQLSICEEERQGKEAELLKLQDQLSLLINDQLQSMKIMLEFAENEAEDKSFGKGFVTKAIEIVDE